ncbi:hypothetical protein EC957_002381 [Mortierella hygrophila]|uniref:Chromo domain-containing protein n=1 Tax=Mortierella hygrophila TaxID=979708 RepID=A0A9P6F4Z8_9FUNG|nr:hypothetical protein EC957_002381 [Mortierella hygrophila]
MTDASTLEATASKEPSAPSTEQKSNETNGTDEVSQPNAGDIKSDAGDMDKTEDKAEENTVVNPEEKSESKVDSIDKATADSKDGGEEEDSEGDAEGAEYEVERVVGHRHTKGKLQYHLKWNGYDSDENTWENKENVFCTDLVEAYWVRHEQAGGSRSDLKGKDGVLVKKEPARTARSNGARRTKKDRDGDTVMNMAPAKRQRTSDTSKEVMRAGGGAEDVTSNNNKNSSSSSSSSNDSSWMPPNSWTSWEDKVKSILTVERSNQKLLIRLLWINGKETHHSIEEAHQKCPQKLIQFYEAHIKFSQA